MKLASKERRNLRMLLRWGSKISIIASVALLLFLLTSSSSVWLTSSSHRKHKMDDLMQVTGCEKKCAAFAVVQEVGVKNDFMESKARRYFGNTLVGTRSTWAEDVIILDQSCPIILSGRHQRSGLGHAFMSFNTLVGIANFYRLTLNATFPERLSHSPDLHEVRQFFGGDVFRARFGHVSCVKHFEVNPKTLADAVGKAKKLCTTGPICIKVADELPPAEILVDVAGYRRNFAVPGSASASLRTLPYLSDDYFRIAIHIRRGDVVNRTRYAGRWVSNQAYLDFIPKLLTRIRTRLPIAVMMFVEGANQLKKYLMLCRLHFTIFLAYISILT